jgi:tellurite resistance protein TehA-like permease
MTALINTLVVCGIILTILISLLFAALIICGIVGIIKYMIDEIQEQ